MSSFEDHRWELVSIVSSKDATIKEELMVWKSDVTNFGSSLVYSQRLSWSMWKKKCLIKALFFYGSACIWMRDKLYVYRGINYRLCSSGKIKESLCLGELEVCDWQEVFACQTVEDIEWNG